MKLITKLAAGALSLALLTGTGVQAQEFPSKTITLTVPFNAGGGTDTLARIIQAALEEAWGQTVVIENKPGASGLVGAMAYLRDSSDGHEILMASTGSVLSLAREDQGMVDDKFQVEKVLRPISQVSQPPYIATVHPSLNVSSIQELIDYAKANPGKVTFGSSGVGAASHLTGVLFEEKAGVDLNHVPYNGMGEAGPALLGGEIDLLFAPAPVVQGYFDDGSLIPLAVTTGEPTSLFPDLPTVSETLEGFSIAGWFGLFGHPDTSDERIEMLGATIREVLGRDDVKAKMAAQGGEPRPMTPGDYQTFVNSDIATWRELQAIVDAN
uniref:Bug family tripartite tricarboxylate transporter substrate binding protein n=1 Tax=Pararhizobium sp. IMCC3301 TaxID=3067904 RepID=UPI002741E236|nr:tripartite tricarboxylate transporter substrate binding protein [Pararhizobium sp. IMCC3301]